MAASAVGLIGSPQREMDVRAIRFDAMPWNTVTDGARQKVVVSGQTRVRLLELTAAFVEQEWCMRAHVGFVVEGDLELTFQTGSMNLGIGDAFVLREGESDRHRAKALGPRVVLLLVEDV